MLKLSGQLIQESSEVDDTAAKLRIFDVFIKMS